MGTLLHSGLELLGLSHPPASANVSHQPCWGSAAATSFQAVCFCLGMSLSFSFSLQEQRVITVFLHGVLVRAESVVVSLSGPASHFSSSLTLQF